MGKLGLMMVLAFMLSGFVRSSSAQESVDARRRPEDPWKAYPTRTLDDLKDFKPSKPILTRYGGLSEAREKATGFFQVKKIGERWWLIDPDGGRFIHVGLCAVGPRQTLGSKEAFTKLFGKTESWAEAATRFMHENGFNGAGAWSSVDLLQAASRPVAGTLNLNMMSSFATKLKLGQQGTGHLNYANNCLPVFHPDFPDHCEQVARKAAAWKDSPWLVGYFSDNEMPSPRDMLQRYLSLEPGNPNRQAAAAWVAQHVKTASPTEADQEAFRGYVYDTYFRIVTTALRRHDPNHLYFGPRFHAPHRRSPAVWQTAGRYCDAIAMNYYDVWGPDAKDLEDWYRWSGKPCLITEFYVKGQDSGMKNSTGAGWIVRTQADRGRFYQNYVLGLLQSRTCIGWHWFKYMDNDPADLSTDPSNRDSNKGVVKITYEPYQPLLERMKAFNEQVYSLVDYLDSLRK